MPEYPMHKWLLKSLILIFAVSGIACACPSDSLEADPSAHTGHEMHLDHAESTIPDCCDECDEAVAMHSESLPIVFDLRFLSDDFSDEPVWLPVAIDTDWSSGDLAQPLPPGTENILPPQSPVIRHDRMLD